MRAGTVARTKRQPDSKIINPSGIIGLVPCKRKNKLRTAGFEGGGGCSDAAVMHDRRAARQKLTKGGVRAVKNP